MPECSMDKIRTNLFANLQSQGSPRNLLLWDEKVLESLQTYYVQKEKITEKKNRFKRIRPKLAGILARLILEFEIECDK